MLERVLHNDALIQRLKPGCGVLGQEDDHNVLVPVNNLVCCTVIPQEINSASVMAVNVQHEYGVEPPLALLTVHPQIALMCVPDPLGVWM